MPGATCASAKSAIDFGFKLPDNPRPHQPECGPPVRVPWQAALDIEGQFSPSIATARQRKSLGVRALDLPQTEALRCLFVCSGSPPISNSALFERL